MVTKAIEFGRVRNVLVQPWGSDMVRLPSGKIMSAADAIRWGIRGER